jgi:AcrR family transcriptional regulator
VDWLSGDRNKHAQERIYGAAAALVESRGFDRVGIDAIARRVGCSRATVYRHVGGIEAIRDVLLIRAAGEVAAKVTEAVDSISGEDRMVAAILMSLKALRAHPMFATVGQPNRTARMLEQRLVSSPRIPAAAAQIAGLPGDDPLAALWMVRVVLGLLYFPVVDIDGAEEAIVRRFVVPVFR